MRRLSDEVLLARTRDDRAAFAEFYRRRYPATHHWFTRVTSSRDLADELSADTFAAALEAAPRFDPTKGSAAAWLFGIARHRWIAWLRDRSQATRIAARAAGTGAIPSADIDDEAIDRVDDLISQQAALASVRRALDLLSPLLREAVVLRVVEELSYQEAAARLGVTPGVVRVRVLRGLRRLGSALAESGPQPEG